MIRALTRWATQTALDAYDWLLMRLDVIDERLARPSGCADDCPACEMQRRAKR